ncbi:cytochrome P450 family protein [Ceratobasidium sp. AG-Ba]|nr:cytochrome P450 family protein [Ceratobasidium sp. AG-Ba]
MSHLNSLKSKWQAEGIAEDSFTSKLLQSEDGTIVDKETKDHVKSLAAALYGAASDTTISVIQSFFLAMTLYPEVQAKAQTEINAYLTKRLGDDPSASRFLLPHDRPRLPYASAVIRELLRWHPVANIIPHQSGAEDDEKVVSDGKTYRIPANTLVIINAWYIMHNPDVYYDPGRFMPERYLVADPPPDPENYAFGFGRRTWNSCSTAVNVADSQQRSCEFHYLQGQGREGLGYHTRRTLYKRYH